MPFMPYNYILERYTRVISSDLSKFPEPKSQVTIYIRINDSSKPAVRLFPTMMKKIIPVIENRPIKD